MYSATKLSHTHVIARTHEGEDTMRRIPVLEVVWEALMLPFTGRAFFIRIGLRSYLAVLGIIAATVAAQNYRIAGSPTVTILLLPVLIPYLISCYRFVVDGKRPTAPLHSLSLQSDPLCLDRCKSFTFYSLAQAFLASATLLAGGMLLFSGKISPLHHAGGLLLVALSILLWLALSFTLPASATGRTTSIVVSAIQVGDNLLPLFTVVFFVATPYFALLCGGLWLLSLAPATVPVPITILLFPLAGGTWFMLFSTSIAVALGAAFRVAVCKVRTAHSLANGAHVYSK